MANLVAQNKHLVKFFIFKDVFSDGLYTLWINIIYFVD